MANGKKFSIDFQQAQEIENTTQILIQSEGWPVEKATLEQIGRALINGNIVPSITGNYPKMSVGFAGNIVGDGSTTEEEFSFRPTAGVNRNTLNDGAARIHTLEGNSVVCNQFCKLLDNIEPQVINGISMTIENDEFIFNGTATSSAVFNISNVFKFTKGHKYYVNWHTNYTNGGWENFATYIPNYHWVNLSLFGAFTGNPFIGEAALSADVLTQVFTVWGGQSVTDIRIGRKPQVIDLTLMFRAGNEPTTVAEFYQRMPLGVDLDVYNEGTIVDGHYGAIKTTGFNQWDEQWEQDAFDYYTGAKIADNSRIRSKNFIPVFPDTQYYYKMPTNWQVCYWDADKQFIFASQNSTDVAENTPQNCHYITFDVGNSGAPITEYNNDICISLYWPTEYGNLYGTYKPYKPFERDLSWGAKYFPNGMRSAGNARDEIRFNSTTQKWEAVQMVGVRAYTEGDENDTAVTTDGTNTNYALATPDIKEMDEIPNFDFDVSDYGTEELVVAEGVESAPLSASIEYSPNVLAILKNAPGIANDVDMLKSQLAALTAQLAALTTANTNE